MKAEVCLDISSIELVDEVLKALVTRKPELKKAINWPLSEGELHDIAALVEKIECRPMFRIVQDEDGNSYVEPDVLGDFLR